MACSCQTKKAAQEKFEVTKKNGERMVVSNEVDAVAAATRYQGTYRKM